MPRKGSKKVVKQAAGEGKRRKRGMQTFKIYIYNVLKQVHPDTKMRARAMTTTNGFVKDMETRLIQSAVELAKSNGKKTIGDREVKTAVRLCLPGQLATHSVAEGVKALAMFENNKDKKASEFTQKKGSQMVPKVVVSTSTRAGLQFPVGRIHRHMKVDSSIARVSKKAAIYLAAVLEYLVAEILELSGNAARDNKKTRISPRHLQLAVRNDEELKKLLGGATIANGGVLPNIHAKLLPKKPGKKPSN